MDSKIINYGIEHDIFSARNKLEEQALKNRLGIGSNFTVLQVGMISPPKNQLESVNAVSSLVNKIPNIKLILAGMTYSEPYERMLKAHIKAEGLEDRVLMTGHVNKNEVRNLYNIADVVVQPVKFQGGWLAPFEAMCAGKPVIISEFVSSSDIIKKNDLGIVTGDFKEAVFQVYSNMDKYAKKAKRSSDWVKNNLRWQDYSEKMLEVCKELVR
jgi:1,2-diacylglycerol 3-alpha-glucosyltransferase